MYMLCFLLISITICSENNRNYPSTGSTDIQADNSALCNDYQINRIVMNKIKNCMQTFVEKHHLIYLRWDEIYNSLISGTEYDFYENKSYNEKEIRYNSLNFKSDLSDRVIRIIVVIFKFWSKYARLMNFLEDAREGKWCEVNENHIKDFPSHKFLNKHIFILEGHAFLNFNIYKYKHKMIAIHKKSEIFRNFSWGNNVIILKKCKIQENTYISDDTLIGKKCHFGSFVTIKKNNIFCKNIDVVDFVCIHSNNVFLQSSRIGMTIPNFNLKKINYTDILHFKIKYSPDEHFYNGVGKILYDNCSRLIIYKGNIFCSDITIYDHCIITNANYFGNNVVVNEFVIVLMKNIFPGENEILKYINIQYKNVFYKGCKINQNIFNNFDNTRPQRMYCAFPYKINSSFNNDYENYKYNNKIFLKELKRYVKLDTNYIKKENIRKLYPKCHIVHLNDPNSDQETIYWRIID